MSITDNYVPLKQLGNGVTVAFSKNWVVLNSSYIRVYLEDVTTGVQVLQTITTDYSVVFDNSGFTVTFVVAPTSGDYAVIARDVAVDQPEPYKTSKGWQGKNMEDSLDKLTAIDQDQQDDIDRSFKLKLGTTGVSAVMEAPSAGKGLMWNGTADAIINSDDDFNTIVSDATVQAVAAAASAAAALVSENAAAADLVLTNADVVSTNADVVLTGNDVTSTNADVVLTGNDVTSTNADVVLTGLDVAATNADVLLTNADVVLTNADVVTTGEIAGAIANKWDFDSSTTMADPGTGDLRLNNATVGSVTAIAISASTAETGNPDISSFINTWDDSSTTASRGIITIRKGGTPATFAIYKINGAITDNTTWLQIPVAHVDSSGTWTASDDMYTGFSRTGDTGATGAAGTVTDGDYGDIVVTGSGATWLFDSAVVTAAAKTVLDDATVSAMLTTLGGVGAATTDTLTNKTIDAANNTLSGVGELATAAEWTAAQNFNATVLTDAATIAWDSSSNQVASVTLAGNRTLGAPTNLKDGANYILTVKQDGTGSRTLAYNAVFKFPGGAAPTLTTTASATDILTFVSDGTNMYGVSQLEFS